jgi:hypothetical protein
MSLCSVWVRNLVRVSQYCLNSEHSLILMWLVLGFRRFRGFSPYTISCVSYLENTGGSLKCKEPKFFMSGYSESFTLHVVFVPVSVLLILLKDY